MLPHARPGDRLLAPRAGKRDSAALRSEKDVDPAEWFFKAHFYSDPVQPGSLGLEAMVQLLQFFMIERNLHDGLDRPRFEPLMIGREHTWKYRGQVIPENRVIRCEMEIVEIGEDERGRYAIADAWLWVDELRIYQGQSVGMRIVNDGDGPPKPHRDGDEEVLDASIDTWVADHCPTYVIPSLPAMSMVDRLAKAAAAHGGVAVEIRDVEVHGWVKVDAPARLKTTSTPTDLANVWSTSLDVWRTRANPRLSRFEPAATGTVVTATQYPEPPTPWPTLADAEPVADPYADGSLFHGPAFRYLKALSMGAQGSSAVLDAAAGSVPPGHLHQGLLDAVLHAVPHDRMHIWDAGIRPDVAAYPRRVVRLALFGPAPAEGAVQVEARFGGVVTDDVGRPHARVLVQAAVDERVWLELELHEVLLPKGPLGQVEGRDRLAFLRDRMPVLGLGLSRTDGHTTTTKLADVQATDWLGGSVAAVYGSASTDPAELLADVGVGDHVARVAGVHPSTVQLHGDEATSTALPLTRWPVRVDAEPGLATVTRTGEPRFDLSPVSQYWDRHFDMGRWPVEDIYYSLIRRFVRRVVLQDPDAHAAVAGRSLLYLGNHQVGVESLLFSILASGLNGVSTVTLAKMEHRTTWLGQLIDLCFRYPEVADPRVITFFDREDKGSLPRIVGELAAEMKDPGKSVMVHIEGTRSLECRTPVQKMSGAFLDMALSVNAPVVPVRFVGGLPPEPLTARLEFPFASAGTYGRQDVWLGRPILPETLRSMTYKDRKDHVIASINGLGPSNAVEAPLGQQGEPVLDGQMADLDLGDATRAWMTQTGTDEPHAVLLQVLSHLDDPTEPIARLVSGARDGELVLGSTPQDRWLSELAQRVYGPNGPRIVTRG